MPKTAQKPVFTKHEMAPIRVEIPGFALGALTDKAQEWADHFNAKSVQDPRAAEVASAWYAVTAALANALSTYNVTLPLPGEKKSAYSPEAPHPVEALAVALRANMDRVAELESQLPLIGISKRADDIVVMSNKALKDAEGAKPWR